MVSTVVAERPAEPLVLDRARTSIVVGSLVVGAVLGFGGNFVQAHTQSVLYAVSAVGLILASVLLAVEHASAGHRFAATGFAMLALGETRVLNPTDVPGGEGFFAVGVLLYVPGLLMIAMSSWAPRWVRLVGAAAAVPFAVHAVAYLSGAAVDSSDPLAGSGYALLTVTIVGWILTVLRSPRQQ